MHRSVRASVQCVRRPASSRVMAACSRCTHNNRSRYRCRCKLSPSFQGLAVRFVQGQNVFPSAGHYKHFAAGVKRRIRQRAFIVAIGGDVPGSPHQVRAVRSLGWGLPELGRRLCPWPRTWPRRWHGASSFGSPRPPCAEPPTPVQKWPFRLVTQSARSNTPASAHAAGDQKRRRRGRARSTRPAT